MVYSLAVYCIQPVDSRRRIEPFGQGVEEDDPMFELSPRDNDLLAEIIFISIPIDSNLKRKDALRGQ